MSSTMSDYTAKKKAKERDDHQCQFCGMTNEEHKEKYPRGLEAHHVIKSNDGGEDHPRNLITVCVECHKLLERTQAEALSRILDIHAVDDNQEEIEQIESQLDNLKDRLQTQRDANKKLEKKNERLKEKISRLEEEKQQLFKQSVERTQEKSKSNTDTSVELSRHREAHIIQRAKWYLFGMSE